MNERQQLIADLNAARAELVMRGRCTGWMVSTSNAVCARGAVAVAVLGQQFADDFKSGETVEAPNLFGNFVQQSKWALSISEGDSGQRVHRVLRQLSRHIPFDEGQRTWIAGRVEDFNDNPATTDEDVLDLFDKALADLGGMA